MENDKTLVEASKKWDYTYWLTQEDIADIARLEYNQFSAIDGSDSAFEILGSLSQLFITLQLFESKIKVKKLNKCRLTLIINLDNSHWVTLVFFYKENNYASYYIDSKNNPIPEKYFDIMLDEFKMYTHNLSPGFIQQQDGYNCGLWALENAADLNKMLDYNQNLSFLITELKRPRNREYFDRKRIYFSEKLSADPVWRERHPLFLRNLEAQKESVLSPDIDFRRERTESDPKRFKANNNAKNEKTIALLEVFVDVFISAFIKKLAAYHFVAKGEILTETAIKNELKTGVTGALIGIGISQSLVGSIPSLVASIRSISAKYYVSKDKPQKISKIFSDFKSDDLSVILSEAAIAIFYSYEKQFMQVTHKAGEKVAIEKLAEDAVDRALNYIVKDSNNDRPVSKQLIEEGVSQGLSEKFFDPSFTRLTTAGYNIEDKSNHKINTADLYGKTGLVILDENNQPREFYAKDNFDSLQYGYRRLFEWEKDSKGELKENFKEQYIKIEAQSFQRKSVAQFILNEYQYILHPETYSREAQRILDKIQNRYPAQSVERLKSGNSIYFDLMKPVKNFSGRIQILRELHSRLISQREIAIVPAYSSLGISTSENAPVFVEDDSSRASSGSQLSISGLGGIGKTQLALRYAELYAKDYDHNVLWINAENLKYLEFSFNKLAVKIGLATRNRYDQEMSLIEIVEAVYEYFSDRKSLFIFDNVEDYQAIKDYLPKSMLGNKPTVLMTSRFHHWENIASVLSLNVFSEKETEELIKKSLDLQENQNKKIQELNELLQGLPLALQQAIAYIKLRRNMEESFSLDHYINLFKIKSKALLDFNFSSYSNDPYLKTVFTTWLITLDKIKKEPLGNEAIEVLNILAYLYPDNISNKKIYYFNHINDRLTHENLDFIMHLLMSYSMINFENKNSYAIHRLVQEVTRLKLQEDEVQFKKIVKKIQNLIWALQCYSKKEANKEVDLDYLNFLLSMSDHKELFISLGYKDPEISFFGQLIFNNLEHTVHFIDLACKKFTKEKSFAFLGKAIAYYIKLGISSNLIEIINYIERQWHEETFSTENVKSIIKSFDKIKDPLLKFKRYSPNREKQENQRQALILFLQFKLKVFGNKLEAYDSCLANRVKRSICSLPEIEKEANKFRQKSIKSHFEKAGQISSYITSALMTKDILSAMLQGRFDEVALDFGLIASSVFLGKISNSLLIQGKYLASEANVLEKSSGLKSKVLDILFNEDVSYVSKRQFLGKAMQVASPFVGKATAIFFAYNLNNQIKAYKMGDKTALPDIVSNSIILGIDGIEAGIETAEFFEIISGLSTFTGPLGEGIALVAFLGAEGYSAKQKLEHIKKYVDLSKEEQVIQFLRAFFHLAPSKYLEVKLKNAESVRHAIDFLKQNTAIKWYAFPSFYNETALYENNVFSNKRNPVPIGGTPDKLNEGHVFCLSGNLDSLGAHCKNIKANTEYFCQHALGVTYAFNRTGNATLIDLGEGEDKAIAFTNSPTLFFVANGKKMYLGNDLGNIFSLRGNAISGVLEGGSSGSDVLILDNFHPEKSDYLLMDANGSLCGKNNHTVDSILPLCSPDEIRIETDQINQIYGRKDQQDIIYPNQNTRFIDGHGGKNKDQPDSLFITEHAYKNLKFVLRNNTRIVFSIKTAIDSIDYRIPADEVGEAQIKYSFEEPIQHRFFFECSLANIEAMIVKNNRLHIAVLAYKDTDKKLFNLTISDHFLPFQRKNTTDFQKNLSYFFENTEVKLINNEQLYVQEIGFNNKTLDEKIGLFSELANRLEKTLSIQLIDNITLSIGQGKHEIFYINPLFENHIVGNGGENVYIILANDKIVFPLPKITLYDTSTTDLNELVELTDTLDLRELIEKYKEIHPNAVISPHVFPSENDLVLTLSNTVYSPAQYDSYDVSCFLPWATIRLKDALYNNTNGYQKLDIFLSSIPKNIVPLDEEFWTLSTAPLTFTEDKKTIFITSETIEEGTKFQILKNMGNYIFSRNETDLILTNAFTSSMDYSTIICCQYYQELEMKKKILSATFEFLDQEIFLRDYEKEIDRAFNFSYFPHFSTNLDFFYFSRRPENKPFFRSIIIHTPDKQQILSQPVIIQNKAFLNSTTIHTPDKQQILSQPVIRKKRQTELEEKRVTNSTPKSAAAKRAPKRVNQTVSNQITQDFNPTSTFNEKERILAIADHYSEQYDHSKRKSYAKKNNNQKQNKKQKISSFIAVAEKKVKPLSEKYHPLHHKNDDRYLKPTVPYRNVPNKLKPLAKSQTENRLQVPFFSKSKAVKLNKNFFEGSKPLYHVENTRPDIKALSSHPKLIYTHNKSESKKPNQNAPSFRIEPPNIHNTLIFLNLFTRKALKNPVKPVSLNRKVLKNSEKVERQKRRMQSTVFGIPSQTLHQ
jgi:hypothetical protein